MAARNILVINCGSSSIKFALVNEAQDAFLMEGLAEHIGLDDPDAVVNWQANGEATQLALPRADHAAVLEKVLPAAEEVAGGKLHGIGHRVVHGGEAFSASTLLDDASLKAIRDMVPLAPLHNPANLQGIEAALKTFPQLPQVAVFDTAFHQTLPEHAYRYALPETLYKQFQIRRYGFHGTSHQYVSRRAAKLCDLPVDNSCWLTAHLGNGCSTAAVVNGESQDTSMGLTPLEGVVMGTRSGDVDPGLQAHLSRALGWSLQRIDNLLNRESGLLGLSGLSNDMRTLEEARAEGHAGATLAIEVYCYRLAKSLAAMGCALPRLDGLIFTGGIGENSALIRAKTVQHLALWQCALDDDRNQQMCGGGEGAIHADGSPRILVVPTNEERQIALDVLALLDS